MVAQLRSLRSWHGEISLPDGGILAVDFLLQHGQKPGGVQSEGRRQEMSNDALERELLRLPLLGKVREDECAFLWQQFVLLHSELLQELTPGYREDGLEQTAAEHLSGLVARQAVVTLGDVAVAQPPAKGEETPKSASNTHPTVCSRCHWGRGHMPGVVHFVGRAVVFLGALAVLRRRLQLPIV